MSAITSRRQANPQVAVAVAGQAEPVAPAYYISRRPGDQLGTAYKVPSEDTEWQAPVVYRGQRKVGMRYLYARGAVRQPISPLGTGPDIGNAVWSSQFQPDFLTLQDWGFNDALFQAGYPGFNLGLSFKVQQLQENPTGGPGQNIRMHSPNIRVMIQRLGSGKGTVQTTG